MAKQSIGELSAVITANAQQFVDELKRTQASVDGVSSAVVASGDKTAKSINAGILGTRLFSIGFMMLRSEVQNTIKNIEDIPGIPQDTIDSVNQLRYGIEGNNSVIRRGIADAAGWFAMFGQGLGYVVADAQFGADATRDAFDKMKAEADAWANKDYTKKLSELQSQFDMLSVQSKGKMAAMLSDEAGRLQYFAANGIVLAGKYNNAMLDALKTQMQLQGGVTEKDKQGAELLAMQDRIKAQTTINALVKQTGDLYASIGNVSEKEARSQMSVLDALKQIDAERSALWRTKAPDITDPNADPIALEKNIEDLKKLKALETERSQDIRKLSSDVKQFGSSVADAFVGSLDGAGDAWKNLAKTIIDQIIKIAFESQVLQPLFHGLGAMATSSGFYNIGSALSAVTFGGAFAGGGDPPVGRASWVGENGPELFVPKTSGTIIPASSSAAAVGGRSGDTYYIDATGADPAAIGRLAGAIASVNGSIEMRSVASVLQQAKTSASFRRAISG